MNSVKELVSTKPGEQFRDLVHCRVGLFTYSKIQFPLEFLLTTRLLVFTQIDVVAKAELESIIAETEKAR